MYISVALQKHLNHKKTQLFCNYISRTLRIGLLDFLIILLGHLSHSGDLFLLWVGVRRRGSSVNLFFSRTTWPILTKFDMYHL